MGQRRRWSARAGLGCALATSLTAAGVVVLSATSAGAALTTTTDPTMLAAAAAGAGATVTGATFVSLPPAGTPHAVADTGTALGGFPTNGTTYSILTTGDANLADDPNTAPDSGADNGGGAVRGDTDRDVSVLRVDLNVPAGANCLRFDFRFLSEEFPEFVNSMVNDAFIAELDTSTWDTMGNVITAPNNFAFDPAGNPITVDSTGSTSVSAANAAGTTYDGATPLLVAATPITSGAHSLFLSIFDQGDNIFDSAVFVDNLRLETAAAGQCVTGAAPMTPQPPTTPVPPVTPGPSDPSPPADDDDERDKKKKNNKKNNKNQAKKNETVSCSASKGVCTVKPKAGKDTKFSIRARGGSSNAKLFAKLNGGNRPNCLGYRETASDWVQVGFKNVRDGLTWRKSVTLTDRDDVSKRKARRLAQERQICFQAPYRFVLRPGYNGSRSKTGKFLGVLPECSSGLREFAAARGLASPCISLRTIVKKDGDWVVRISVLVPAGFADPLFRG